MGYFNRPADVQNSCTRHSPFTNTGAAAMSQIVVFSGHMIDSASRAEARFPQHTAAAIGQRIAAEVDALGVGEAYGCAACGGDILFLEAVLARGGRVHIVLPCAVEEFRQVSVDFLAGSDWGQRFEAVMAKASSIEILADQYAEDNGMAHECCNRVMVGLAAMKAAEQGGQPTLLALWNGKPGDGLGGTYSMVQFCRARGFRIRLMRDLEPDARSESRDLPAVPTAALPSSAASAEPAQHICALVFADAVGFSKLRERQLPVFARHYLGGIMQVLAARECVPLVKNTWGDGLYLVFATMREAGLFALDFQLLIAATDWKALGLPEGFSARIGIHAGPVYKIYDPVLGQWNYIGSHVTRAARIEPTVPKGEVYASRAFAALATAERVREFRCEAVGTIELVKGYGAMPAYRLQSTAM